MTVTALAASAAPAAEGAAMLRNPLAGGWHLVVGRAGRALTLEPSKASRGRGVYTWRAGALEIALRARKQSGDARAWVLRAQVTNRGRRAIRLDSVELVLEGLTGAAELAPVRAKGARVFLDSGWLGGSGARDFGVASARHESHGVAVIVDASRRLALAAGFLTFRDAHVTLTLSCDEEGRWNSLSARSDFWNGRWLEPGGAMQSEALWLRCCDSGHEGLERWADAVARFNRLAPPRGRPSGWNSWYAYRLTITEDLVLANARIMAERFREYGATNIQIDHGWQYKDIVGNWVPNERFPHGLKWLAARLREMGLTLGLWTAVSHVSEFAPFYREHPEALLHDASGDLSVAWDRWYWEPHGRTFTPDSTHPLGLRFYREAGRMLREYGAAYVKNDFQGNLMRSDVVPHDRRAPLGPPLYLLAMRAFQQGLGQGVIRHGCNAPLNVGAGMWDAAWVHRDIGNPRNDWKELAGFAQELACHYHTSGKFYWGDPDYLQVGQGEPNETRVRMALMALGGGPSFICDRLPELPEEKLRLISRCLPGYGMPAVPLDLFERDTYPRIWWLDVRTKWDRWAVVGVFNLDDDAAVVEVPLDRVPGKGDLYAFEFFSGGLMNRGPIQRDAALRVPVPARDVRVVRLAAMPDHPWVIGTDLHLTQGAVELESVRWDAGRCALSGVAHRARGERGSVFVLVPAGYQAQSVKMDASRIARIPLRFDDARVHWQARFARTHDTERKRNEGVAVDSRRGAPGSGSS